MRIRELAAELGLNPKTIRYCEEIGVLPEPRRTAAGYRVYEARSGAGWASSQYARDGQE